MVEGRLTLATPHAITPTLHRVGAFLRSARDDDVTYVGRGQLAVIAQLRTEPSERAKEAIARVIERRKNSR